MTKLPLRVTVLLALAAAIFAMPAATRAQNFPTQRVTIVVPFGAGSVTAYFVHVARSQKDNDGFFIPPIVFIDVAAGGVVGGLIGWAIHDATHQR